MDHPRAAPKDTHTTAPPRKHKWPLQLPTASSSRDPSTGRHCRRRSKMHFANFGFYFPHARDQDIYSSYPKPLLFVCRTASSTAGRSRRCKSLQLTRSTWRATQFVGCSQSGSYIFERSLTQISARDSPGATSIAAQAPASPTSSIPPSRDAVHGPGYTPTHPPRSERQKQKYWACYRQRDFERQVEHSKCLPQRLRGHSVHHDSVGGQQVHSLQDGTVHCMSRHEHTKRRIHTQIAAPLALADGDSARSYTQVKNARGTEIGHRRCLLGKPACDFAYSCGESSSRMS